MNSYITIVATLACISQVLIQIIVIDKLINKLILRSPVTGREVDVSNVTATEAQT